MIVVVLWYGFNALYNVLNQEVKKTFPFPYMIATLQLGVGLFFVVPLWVLKIRKVPRLSFFDLLKLLPIAVLNTIGHASGVVAMFEVGGGSLTHVIKASEPVVTVILNMLAFHDIPKLLTSLSLLPITYGVAYASTLGKLDWNSISRELTTKAAL